MLEIFLATLFGFLISCVRCSGESPGMDFGDAMALILGLVITTLGILACLGKYARTIAAGQF